jgi:hypothetical protein
MTIQASTSSILSTALAGLKNSLNSINENAAKISGFGTNKNPDGDLVTPIIEMKADMNQFKAITKVIKVTEKMDKAVLDIMA